MEKVKLLITINYNYNLIKGFQERKVLKIFEVGEYFEGNAANKYFKRKRNSFTTEHNV